jgi:hypothetical protein
MAGGYTWRVFGAPISKKRTLPQRLPSDGSCAIESCSATKYRSPYKCLPLLVVPGSKCIEILKEIKLPDFLTDSPRVVSEILISLAEVL